MEKQQPFKISIEHYGEKMSIEVPESDVTLEKSITMFRDILLCAGYSKELINKYFDIEPV